MIISVLVGLSIAWFITTLFTLAMEVVLYRRRSAEATMYRDSVRKLEESGLGTRYDDALRVIRLGQEDTSKRMAEYHRREAFLAPLSMFRSWGWLFQELYALYQRRRYN